ncbi:MAG: ParB/RepB/Spo0J family partition protein [Ruminococcaceae bacterium]|nr:ParB/RepB/Spo0J family partition protein [Oscillospiraceae bacterium]
MAKEKGSGRGLDAIFIDNYEMESDKTQGVTTLRLSDIEPEPTQPRSIFDHEPLEELASSIATHGLLQPIVVREGGNGYYKIIAGERRWRASKMAGLTEVPVIIIEADDRKAAELSLIENLQRENLNPIEEASAFKALIEEYDLTQEEVSSRIGKSRSAVANSMRLLDLPKEVLELVKGNDLSAGHARALLGLTNRAIMPEVAKKVIAKGLSVRLTEDLVRSLNKKEAFANKEEDVITEVSVNYIADLEKRVASHIGRIIKIREKGKKKRLEIEYSDNSDLENIIKKLCGSTFFDD